MCVCLRWPGGSERSLDVLAYGLWGCAARAGLAAFWVYGRMHVEWAMHDCMAAGGAYVWHKHNLCYNVAVLAPPSL
jgi:hypothetical protein